MSGPEIQTVRHAAMLVGAIHDYMDAHRINLAREMGAGSLRVPQPVRGRSVPDAEELLAASKRYREHLARYEDWLRDILALWRTIERSNMATSAARETALLDDGRALQTPDSEAEQ